MLDAGCWLLKGESRKETNKVNCRRMLSFAFGCRCRCENLMYKYNLPHTQTLMWPPKSVGSTPNGNRTDQHAVPSPPTKLLFVSWSASRKGNCLLSASCQREFIFYEYNHIIRRDGRLTVRATGRESGRMRKQMAFQLGQHIKAFERQHTIQHVRVVVVYAANLIKMTA